MIVLQCGSLETIHRIRQKESTPMMGIITAGTLFFLDYGIMPFHHGTGTGLSSNPEAIMIGK